MFYHESNVLAHSLAEARERMVKMIVQDTIHIRIMEGKILSKLLERKQTLLS